MKEYEYLIITPASGHLSSEELNDVGGEGWYLIRIHTPDSEYTFVREKEEVLTDEDFDINCWLMGII